MNKWAHLGAFFRVWCLSPCGLCSTTPFEHENTPTWVRFHIRRLSHSMYPLEHVEHAHLGMFYVFGIPPPIHSCPSPTPPPLPPQTHQTCPSGRVRCARHLFHPSTHAPAPPHLPNTTTSPDGLVVVLSASPTLCPPLNTSNTPV